MTAPTTANPVSWQQRWQTFSSTSVRWFHAYANWLTGISWRRFIVLSLVLVVVVAMVHDMPPFTWRYTEQVEARRPHVSLPKPPKAPKRAQSAKPPEAPEPPADVDVHVSIGKNGIKISPRTAAEAASAAASAASGAQGTAGPDIEIKLPPGLASDAVREALEQARREIGEAMRREQENLRERRAELEEAAREAEEARRQAQAAIDEMSRDQDEDPPMRTRTRRTGIGDFLLQLSWAWVLASAVIKATYKGRVQAEVKAAQATETAEAESLKRQVVEARMAAMQAQVEPHFLFNTLASIDHLIETDPARASTMQKNLIALLRASMPTMREASDGGVRDLGRELAVIRPYLEILKVRMEERLVTDIQVPDGLLSAEFPPMMVQTLVENAIKHGLEPKAEGGSLRLKAEIVHGKLQVTVADTGLGFGKAATAGTGVGLANIRERLQLLYGPRATLTVAENQPSGTVVTITVPYKTVEGTPL